MAAQTLTADSFISRWEKSGAAERANYALFLSELCDLLEVTRPEPAQADSTQNSYVFEHPVLFDDGLGNTTTKFIDLYKRDCFVLEAKQGSDKAEAAKADATSPPKKGRKGTAVRGTHGWDDAMLAAKGQAELYAKALPASDGWPPFLVVVDVGHSIELYADFARTGKTYVAFPDSRSHRIPLRNLTKSEIKERLKKLWTDPLSLDPSRYSAKVTREVAVQLAELAKSLERSKHPPELVASFLMRCLFTMFAEDVGLLPKESFKTFLKSRRGKVDSFPAMTRSLWEAMDRGDFSPILEKKLLRFNGQLFHNAEALPLTDAQLELLITAASSDWREVEPAIFGTLLERALDPGERHKLGAHYTPREYVERLVIPTIVEPLREEWEAAKAAAVTRAKAGKLDDARGEVQEFINRLQKVTVLDPACGSGNFLYVTLEHLKRIEGEARDMLSSLGGVLSFEAVGFTVDPHQLLGIEVNPRAAAIAELVLWIGYLQWHFRTFGNTQPAEPVIKAFRNIECRDGVLSFERKDVLRDDSGNPVTRWDGKTMKTHPVTGEQVPDDTAREPCSRYEDPKEAVWPAADFVIGNPPFIGVRDVRLALGDGYVDALWKAYPDMPRTADYVMYWWHKAAKLVREGKARRFGLITTNSITQTFNGQVVQTHLADEENFSLAFAIADHPWTDASDGAAVRIGMTVGLRGALPGVLGVVENESDTVTLGYCKGRINSDLTVGVDVRAAKPLRSNENLGLQGCKLVGDRKLDGGGFFVQPSERQGLLVGRAELSRFLPRYVVGNHIVKQPREVYAIDFFGLSQEQAREQFPEALQLLYDRVKPARDQNRRESRKRNWWLFGENAPKLRRACQGLTRFIATTEVAKHRVFVFVPLPGTLADGSIVAIAHEDAFVLGVLSSRIHVTWALAAGGRMGFGNDPRYQNGPCFSRFPFPVCSDEQKAKIRNVAERLDAHRKRQQAMHASLTLTDAYNVFAKLRAGEALSTDEKGTHDKGLVSLLKDLHDELDRAVFEAYDWPTSLGEQQILERVVALNAVRVSEENRDEVRWLRPDFQKPAGDAGTQSPLPLTEEEETVSTAKTVAARTPWPKALAAQAQAVRVALTAQSGPITAERLAKTFLRARVDKVAELLETLASLGQAIEISEGRYVSAAQRGGRQRQPMASTSAP
ncbi:hypothetical protein ETAA1_03650 [Urbifossiella limnaea]|uniref:site-specific DNA-methyltransferase (adenine-specific) n=2 Tax=Urbifossiella limnaea TaxID=2528023 RepID=A0A517XLU0_9BACT|nr:hypothetical protein ETAA1_03650 [Urbifossiella limnaea]